MQESLDRLTELRAGLPPEVRVQVDGGINRDTVRSACDAGADLVVAGSAIFWHDDPPAAYRELEAYGERFAEPLALEADACMRHARGDDPAEVAGVAERLLDQRRCPHHQRHDR